MDYEITNGVYNILPNEILAKIMQQNLEMVGGYTYTGEERAFAEKIQASFSGEVPDLNSTAEVLPLARRDGSASTDVADVTWVVPTMGLRAATWVPGTSAHSWQAVAAGGMSIGHKGMMIAAKTMAGTMVDLFASPAYIEQAQDELAQRRGKDFRYEALLGDRPPALDYRK
jgi:aminobenzoyl-glutamate utilization protein B